MTIAAWSSGKSMTDSPYRNPADFSIAEPTHCLFCGAERNAQGECASCGAVVAAPSNDESLGMGYPCPRCKEMLVPEPFGRSIVKACAKCHGLFVPSLQFSFIVNDYLAGIELPVGKYPPPPPRAQEEIERRFAQVACIACQRAMDRVNFASRSGATVDVCEAHGIWIDGGELVPILHFLKTRAELGEVPLTDVEKQERIELDKARDESTQRMELDDLARKEIRRSMGRYR
jgi:Zn-finger nucleic acid-binding protein